MTSSCLVLDVGYQPHLVVSWHRAVTLIFEEKAEVLESYNESLMTSAQAQRAHSAGWTVILKIPAVIRLFRRIMKKRIVRFSRMNVLLRDKFTCQYCGKKLPTDQLNHDHVVPKSQGGKTTWENVVASCYPCNLLKRDRAPNQAGMKLMVAPVRPKALPLIALRFELSDSIPEAWRSWIYWNASLEED